MSYKQLTSVEGHRKLLGRILLSFLRSRIKDGNVLKREDQEVDRGTRQEEVEETTEEKEEVLGGYHQVYRDRTKAMKDVSNVVQSVEVERGDTDSVSSHLERELMFRNKGCRKTRVRVDHRRTRSMNGKVPAHAVEKEVSERRILTHSYDRTFNLDPNPGLRRRTK